MYDRSRDAYDASLNTFERSFDAAGLGRRRSTGKSWSRTAKRRCNLRPGPELSGRQEFTDIVELQAAFWRKQFGVLTEQAKEVGALSAKVMAENTEQGKAAAGGQRGPR